MSGITLADLDAVADLIEAALERPAAERRTFLREACADDPERLTTAERVLPVAEQALAFLDEPAAASVGDLLREAVTAHDRTDGQEAPAARPAPDRIGPWLLLRSIGRGGMGEVWLAERDDAEYDRRVAIKIMRAGSADPDMAARFRTERQILARLDHPNIARLYDGGVTDREQPFIVMEYVEGRPIDTHCDEERLDIDRRLDLFAEVCQAVAWAHRKLVVHRDIKPANILVDADGRVKLLDFGVAKLLGPDGASPGTPRMTRAGFRLLTPEYASPEQFRGELASTATDVYSLGVLLYELLAGAAPYRVTGQNIRAIEKAVLETEPDRPGIAFSRTRIPGDTEQATSAAEIARRRASTVERLGRRLAGDLDTITLKALRKDPEQRYPSVDALLEDIRRHRARLPIIARPQTWSYRVGRFVRRNRIATALTALLVVSLVGGSVATAWQARTSALEARKAEQIRDFLVGVFDVADPDRARGASVTARELLDRGAARVDVQLAGQPEVRAEMLGVLGTIYRRLGLLESSRTPLETALELRRATGAPPEDLAESLTDLAATLFADGEYERAEALQREALDIRRRTEGPSSTAYAAVSLDIAASLSARGEYEAARPLYQTALHIQTDAGDSAALAEVLNGYGLMLERAGDNATATDVLRHSVALRRSELGNLHTSTAVSLCNLAGAFQSATDFEAAARAYAECLSIRRQLLEPDHPAIGRTLNNIAMLEDNRGNLETADSLHREALAVRQAAFGDFHPEVAGSLNNIAILAYRRGDYAGAARSFRDVLAQWRELVGVSHPNTITTLNNLGMTLGQAGDLAAAESVLRETLAARTAVLGPDHPQVGESHLNLASILVRLGRHSEAEAHYRTGITVLDAAYPDGHTSTASGLVGMARALRPQGRCAEAIESVERAVAIRAERLGDEHTATADARLWLGRCLADVGRTAEAIDALEAARATLLTENGEAHETTREVVAELERARRARQR